MRRRNPAKELKKTVIVTCNAHAKHVQPSRSHGEKYKATNEFLIVLKIEMLLCEFCFLFRTNVKTTQNLSSLSG